MSCTEPTVPCRQRSGLGELFPRVPDKLKELDPSYTLKRLYDSVNDASPLSSTQREALLAAAEQGYYDTPRDISLIELAEELNTAESSLSGTLHRAEEIIVRTFVTDRLDADTDMDSPGH